MQVQVKVVDYGINKSQNDEKLYHVKYKVTGLDNNLQKKLIERLEEETESSEDDLIITVYYAPEYFPFGSDEASIRMGDFIARDEIEMTVFLSGVLEDE